MSAATLLAPLGAGLKVGVHVSGGRAVKQWPEGRFRDVAERLIRDRRAGVVLTGAPADRPQIAMVRSSLPPDRVVDLSGGVSLLTTAAVIEQLDLLRPIYRKTAAYGHFGRDDVQFPWENTDKAAALCKAAGL